MEGSNVSNDKNVSALEHNIKTKKDCAYYYAHAYKFDKKEDEQNAQVISGPGIITGGDPVLLAKNSKPVEVKKEMKTFTKYIFYDDDKSAVVKITLPDEIKDLVTQDCIDMEFQERSINLRVNVPNQDSYFLVVKKLHKKIIPDESKVKLIKGKISINLRKKDEDDEWSKLTV